MALMELFFGSAFGLFIALLAWGDQIRKPRKEIMQLEERFRDEYNLPKQVTNPFIRKSYQTLQDSTKYSFLQQTKAMIKLLENPKMRKCNVKLLEEFRKLHEIREGLEKKYRIRYFFSIGLCILLFVFSILSGIYSNIFIIFKLVELHKMAGINLNSLYFILVLVLIAIIITNLVTTYFKEEQFIKSLYEIDDKIEGRN